MKRGRPNADRWWRATCVFALLVMPASRTALVAQTQSWIRWTSRPVVVVDSDDDDDDGMADDVQLEHIPLEDLAKVQLQVNANIARVKVETRGGLRVIQDGKVVPTPCELPVIGGELRFGLQGVRTIAGMFEARLIFSHGLRQFRLPVRRIGLRFLDARNSVLDPSKHAVGVSREITNNASLPRSNETAITSSDPENLRLQVEDPGRPEASHPQAQLLSREQNHPRSFRLFRHQDGVFRSFFVRLVGDDSDAAALGVADRVLRVGLRDHLAIVYQVDGVTLSQDIRVGRPGNEMTHRSAKYGKLRVRILRVSPGGPAVVGANDAVAERIGRDQVAIANEVWLQCYLSFGNPTTADVEIVDPPPPALLAVGDSDGLYAEGGGQIAFQVDKKPVTGLTTRKHATPVQTALQIADKLRRMGWRATVTENPSTEFGAGPSADVVIRRPQGSLANIEPFYAKNDTFVSASVSTDKRQTVKIGRVLLADGLFEFNNMNSSSGSLEERTMIKLLRDADPRSIDLFIVNRFSLGTRQGEAFIPSSGSAMTGAVILDRSGIRQQRTAWTQAHEIGHVLLDQPYHPDHVWSDQPWMLMDADNSMGSILGPKRLSQEECDRLQTNTRWFLPHPW